MILKDFCVGCYFYNGLEEEREMSYFQFKIQIIRISNSLSQ